MYIYIYILIYVVFYVGGKSANQNPSGDIKHDSKYCIILVCSITTI